MARRLKRFGTEGLIGRLRLQPWWVGLLLAIPGYGLPVLLARASGWPAGPWQGWAEGVSWVLPGLCVAAASWSLLRRKPAAVLASPAGSPAAAELAHALQSTTDQTFMLRVAEGFRRRGYVVQIPARNPDGDDAFEWLVMRQGERSLVQCSQWKAAQVDVAFVQALHESMAARQVAGGFVVTSGEFTQQAIAYASGRRIRLIDGAALMQLLRQVGAGAA